MSRGKNQRRMRRRNEHHLLWKASDYRGSYAQVRLLPCCRVMLDREVHRVLHKLYDYPRRISPEDATYLVTRHKQHLCACYDGEETEVNILEVGGEGRERRGDPPGGDDGPAVGQLQFLW